MRFKMWLRNPGSDPQVEIIGDSAWYWRSGHFSQRIERSVMAELLSEDEVQRLQLQPGRWLLPGIPP
ncbi:hypothetical protein EDD30_5773 [Couchioplanes caeruleus]|uniref:Uncharacterized protein n=1 Tax=Couchioplanes caeruleus TaxID=56438 RepID=A0A3N1GRJ0_9ACTN|nr:hypothetical protein EDD30_5773 [Couchioplanes caeruleus]